MDSIAIIVVTAMLFGWGLVSKRSARADLTARGLTLGPECRMPSRERCSASLTDV